MNARRKIVMAIAGLVIAAAFAFVADAYLSSQRQDRNMQKAAEHIARIEPSIRADARFQNVRLLSYTSDDGCLFVDGYVESEQALNDLRRVIEGSNPPVFTKFAVAVLSATAEGH